MIVFDENDVLDAAARCVIRQELYAAMAASIADEPDPIERRARLRCAVDAFEVWSDFDAIAFARAAGFEVRV